MNWYALYVQTGAEESVRERFRKRFDAHTLRCVIPKRKIPEKKNGQVCHAVKILFPGYVLIQTRMNFSVYNEIQNMPRVYKLLNYMNRKDKLTTSDPVTPKQEEQFFKPIPEEEMALILKLIDDTDTLEYSKVFIENSRVNVISGPLKGMEGIIKKVDKRKKRAKIALSFMDSEKIIDVGVEILSVQ